MVYNIKDLKGAVKRWHVILRLALHEVIGFEAAAPLLIWKLVLVFLGLI